MLAQAAQVVAVHLDQHQGAQEILHRCLLLKVVMAALVAQALLIMAVAAAVVLALLVQTELAQQAATVALAQHHLFLAVP